MTTRDRGPLGCAIILGLIGIAAWIVIAYVLAHFAHKHW